MTLDRANGAVTTYSYDGADRIRDLHTVVGSDTVARFTYDVNRLGLRTDVTEVLTSTTRTVTYRYDGLLRLTGATERGATTNSYAYGYDLAGNRTSTTANGTTTTQSYNAANQVVGWSYDAAGNLLTDGTTTYGYDALNRWVREESGVIRVYNGDGVYIVRSDSFPYVQDLAAPLDQILGGGEGDTAAGDPLGFREYYGVERLASFASYNTRTDWYIHDALGSVRQTLDSTGAVQATASYAPFGEPQGSSIAPFGFTGEFQDQGLVNLRARWYDPRSGVFTGVDPWSGFPETPYSLHPYQYAYGAPTTWTDPSGELAIFVHGGFGDQASTAINPVYELARKVEGFVPNVHTMGPGDFTGVLTSAYTPEFERAMRLIEDTYVTVCTDERLALVGYSRGGAMVQALAHEIKVKYPMVRIDLVITIGPVNFSQRGGGSTSERSSNVARHINFRSEQAWAAGGYEAPNDTKHPYNLPGHLPEQYVSGADINETIPGTSHFSVMEQPMKTWKREGGRPGMPEAARPRVFDRFVSPNPVWEAVIQEFWSLYP